VLEALAGLDSFLIETDAILLRCSTYTRAGVFTPLQIPQSPGDRRFQAGFRGTLFAG
jgi:hypothetical protein